MRSLIDIPARVKAQLRWCSCGDAVKEISTCYLWDHREELSKLVDVWEAANRDDLFPVTSLKHYPYVANSDFYKPKHLYSWKTLLRCEKNWPAIKEALRNNVDVALTLFRNRSWAAQEGGQTPWVGSTDGSDPPVLAWPHADNCRRLGHGVFSV